MLNRLYRTDMERLVLSFEMIRNALQREIDRRNVELQSKQQQPSTIYVPKGSAIQPSDSSPGLSSSSISVEAAVPLTTITPLVKSSSQPIGSHVQTNPYLISSQAMPPPPAQFNISNNYPVQNSMPTYGPVKSASQGPIPSLNSIHSVLLGSNSASSLSFGQKSSGGTSLMSSHSSVSGHHQLPLGKTISSTSMTSGHGSILESSSSTSSLFSSISGSHPSLATSNSSIHSITSSSSSQQQQQTCLNTGQVSLQHEAAGNGGGLMPTGVVSGPSYTSFAHLYSSEEETKV